MHFGMDTIWRNNEIKLINQRVLSIMPMIPEISVGIQMERSFSVPSNWNTRDHLWRWSTYFDWNFPTDIRCSIFDKLVLCPNKGIW